MVPKVVKNFTLYLNEDSFNSYILSFCKQLVTKVLYSRVYKQLLRSVFKAKTHCEETSTIFYTMNNTL